jgi:hypothetical protein
MRRVLAVALTAVAVAALAACSSGTTGGPGTAPTSKAATEAVGGTPVTGPHTMPTSPGSTPDTPVAPPPTTPANCTIDHLSVVSQHGSAASGHRSMVLVFTNHGPVCRLFGYPGVAALNGGGAQIEQAVRTTNGYMGGLPAGQNPVSAYLSNGESASAIVEAVAYQPNGDACTPYAGLLVTPPNETHSVKLTWDNDGCASLQIHPVVLGTTGQGS